MGQRLPCFRMGNLHTHAVVCHPFITFVAMTRVETINGRLALPVHCVFCCANESKCSLEQHTAWPKRKGFCGLKSVVISYY